MVSPGAYTVYRIESFERFASREVQKDSLPSIHSTLIHTNSVMFYNIKMDVNKFKGEYN